MALGPQCVRGDGSIGRRAKDPKGAPPEKRGIMGVSNRVDETAKRIRAKYGAKPGKEFMDRQAQDDIEEEELTVTESESDDDLGPSPAELRLAAARRRAAMEARVASKNDEDPMPYVVEPPSAQFTARDPWSNFEPLHLNNMRVDMHVQCEHATQWPRPDAQETIAKPQVWKCPCGAAVGLPLRRDHLRYDCAPYRDSFENATRKWLAARDPETGGAAVQRVSMIAACGAGEALCALAVNRKESVAQRKLQAEDYRDEMELAAEVIAAEDLLERWHAGAGALSPK